MSVKSKLLYLIIISCFIFQVSKFYDFYSEYSAWQYVDWIINYQGGFVRRGLSGEILFKIHTLTNIKLDFLIFLFVTLIYFFVLIFLIKLVKYVEYSQLNTLIFLSPGFFLYPVMNSEVIGRKDILFLFIISFFVLFEKKLNNKNLLILKVLSIFYLCLSHSIFLFYTPYLLFLYFLIKSSRKILISWGEILIFLISILTIFLLIYFNQGNELVVSEICQSVKNFVSTNCEESGQMFWLGQDAKSHISVQTIKPDHLFIYISSLILTYFFIFIKFYNTKIEIKYYKMNLINPILILLILFLFTLPVYYLGSDWGRYISISFTGAFFIFIYCIKEKLFKQNYELSLNKIFFMLLVIFYSFFWTFPFYHADKIKFTLKKPISKIISKFNFY